MEVDGGWRADEGVGLDPCFEGVGAAGAEGQRLGDGGVLGGGGTAEDERGGAVDASKCLGSSAFGEIPSLGVQFEVAIDESGLGGVSEEGGERDGERKVCRMRFFHRKIVVGKMKSTFSILK